MLDVALEQVVDRTVEHFGHLFKLRLRDVSVDHPIVDGFTGDPQRFCKLLNGQLSAASLCVDVGIKQFQDLLSCRILLKTSNCNYNILISSICKAKKYPNRTMRFCANCSIRVF